MRFSAKVEMQPRYFTVPVQDNGDLKPFYEGPTLTFFTTRTVYKRIITRILRKLMKITATLSVTVS